MLMEPKVIKVITSLTPFMRVGAMLRFLLAVFILWACTLDVNALWDKGMNFQGRVLSNKLAFNGLGKIKFAIL